MAHSNYAGALPSRCTWKIGTSEKSPHPLIPPRYNDKILDNITEHIGNTPVVRINRIGKSEGLKCELGKLCRLFESFFHLPFLCFFEKILVSHFGFILIFEREPNLALTETALSIFSLP